MDMTEEVANMIQETMTEKIVADSRMVEERRKVAESTVQWWLTAHKADSPYHQQFPLYCMWCRDF